MIHRPSSAQRASDFFADRQEAIRLIAEYTRGFTVEQFIADSVDAHKTRDSVIKNMIDIGEAANNVMQLAPEIEQRNPAMWRHLRGAIERQRGGHELFLLVQGKRGPSFLPQIVADARMPGFCATVIPVNTCWRQT